MATRAEALKWFRSQVGATSGRPYWKIVMGYESDADWCAMFLSAGFKATGTKCAYFPDSFAFDKRDLGRIGDRWVAPYQLQAGDPLSFDFDGGGEYGGDHVGIVESVLGPGYYRTIEGNVSRTCAYRYRRVGVDGIIGGIRPDYDKEDDDVYAFSQIKRGAKGDLVSLMQAALNVRGGAGLLVDGDFGSITESAVKSYQRRCGIGQDGICGKKTWPALLGK